MSVFGNILGKIFHHDKAKAATPPLSAPTAAPVSTSPSAPTASAAPTQHAPAPAPAVSVDVGAVLVTMAGMKADHGGNYTRSIVDLLKLLDLDSSLTSRKELAEELGVHAGDHGSAEQNIALHRAVMDKLAANGGVVPDSLRQ